MAYDFKKSKFSAIERDKQTLNTNTSKTIMANSAFGSSNLSDLMPAFGNNLVELIDLDLIKPRSVNDFKKGSLETLKQSIENLTLFFPILVRTSDNGKYIIISGHRRYQATKELLGEYKVKKAELEKKGEDTSEVDKKIETYSKIKATVFTIVDEDSELLSTDPKYITKAQEEQMYVASNAEGRNGLVEGKSGYVVVKYFYDLINGNVDLQNKILKERNESGVRKTAKINYPKVIAKFITDDLGYNVAPSYIWQVLNIVEDKSKYPAYKDIAIKRIESNEKVKTVYTDYIMAAKLHNAEYETEDLKEEYTTRMEKGSEPMIDIYNEFYNITDYKKDSHAKKEDKISKADVVQLINDIAQGKITALQALTKVKNM